MLTGLAIRDVVLIEALDLEVGPGLTALTGETGAGKSIVLDALGLATGARADAGLVRRGAVQAQASAVFAPPPGHPALDLLRERGFSADPGEDLVLRRHVAADGRSRAFVNDQPASVGVLRELGAMLVEVHGQHDAVGLLDARTHRALLDGCGGVAAPARACREAFAVWREARGVAEALAARAERDAADAEELQLRLAELERLDPRDGEEAALAERRALLGSAEKVTADIDAARDAFSTGQIATRLAQASRALERARERVRGPPDPSAEGAADDDAPGAALHRLGEAAGAVERALIEAEEAFAAIDRAAAAFVFDPSELDKAEERLFALRAAARKLGVATEALPVQRARFAEALRGLETAGADLAAAQARADAARAAYLDAAGRLSAARRDAGDRLAAAVQAELGPLKLDKARFRAVVEPLGLERAGADGVDRVTFEISTNPGAPFGPLGDIASGGELARLALALKVSLAGRDASARAGAALTGPAMIFDEVDQGVGGAVADAVGQRLKRLARTGQVLVVTHSPQVAARADAHWRVSKSADGERTLTAIDALAPASREEEIARMLAGAKITDAARAAARALMQA